MRNEPHPGDSVIDSRDIIERIAELEANENGMDDEEKAELAMWREVAEDGETNASDWSYGATLIRDSYFEDYARELAEDIGAVSKDLSWPACHIDWEAAADALKMDYTEIEIDGETYWVRS